MTNDIGKSSSSTPDTAYLEVLLEEKGEERELIIHTSPDEVRAYLTLRTFGPGLSLSSQDVIAKMRVVGIDPSDEARKLVEDAFIRFPKEPICIERRLVAQGKERTRGNDGQIIWHVKTPGEMAEMPVVDESGRVDYRELGLITNVRAEEKILEFLDPEDGKAGVSVFGVEMPGTRGRPVGIRHGAHVRTSPDGHTFFATVDGRVVYRSGIVDVDPVYQVEGDVDFSTGNIDFKGQVVVRKSVLDGFIVKAEKGVQVNGVVGSATIESGGDIVVKGGVAGKGKASLVAKGNVQAKYLDQVEVKCRGNLVIANEILNTNAEVGGDVIIRSGRIIGGSIKAMGKIHAGTVGSVAGTRTVLVAGKNIEVEGRLRQVQTELTKLRSIHKSITDRIGPLLEDKEKLKKLPPHRLEQVKEMVVQLKEVRESIGEFEKQREELESSSTSTGERKIVIERQLMGGVEVSIGDCRRNMVEELQGPLKLVPNEEDGSIRVVGYR